MLNKTSIDIPFSQGLDTKTDPKRVTIGKFIDLQNTVFGKGGLLQKRNGYAELSQLSSATEFLTTYNDDLVALGSTLYSYNNGIQSWTTNGALSPMQVQTVPMIKNNMNQLAVDSVVAANGLVCSVFLESDGSTTTSKYVVTDAATGQVMIQPKAIPVTSGTVSGGMRVFLLGTNFIIIFTNTITGVAHLQYISVSSINPTLVSANVELAPLYIPASTVAWDGCVVNNSLYVAYNTTSGGQSVKVLLLSSSLQIAAPVSIAGRTATMVTVSADLAIPSEPIIYVSFFNASDSTGYVSAVDKNANILLAPVQIIASGTVLNITSVAIAGQVTVFTEVSHAYTWDSGAPTNFINAVTVTAAGVVGTPYVAVRGLGLASKAFVVSGVTYFLGAYQSPYQPSYFLVNGSTSTQARPAVVARVAYQNGGGYLTTGLPSVTVNGSQALVPYRFKDMIQAVNKNTNVPTGNQTAGIYSQTGLNLMVLKFGDKLFTSEIGRNLHISGGLLWMFDGSSPVEHGFLVYPDTNIPTPVAPNNATWSATGGSMAAKPDSSTNTNAYYYQFVYEWTDHQGNAFRSAPSLPIAVTTTGVLSTGSVVLNIPTLRLTYKTDNPVKIVIYRWSVAQQMYYQVTSLSTPLMNSTIVDEVTFTDTQADASILGNNLIYTTGGVVENIAAPPTNIMTLFDTRLWLLSSENTNLLWYSKQVIEGVPVEMSDLFTVYVAPTTAAQGSTGPISALSVLDDKLIVFKRNAIYYINGNGPDNTGLNGQYSQPVFITSTVGCTNQNSIVFMPQGLMFQSDKGIWLLDRNMSTAYIGAPVEDLTNGATVVSAQNIPSTNQVRFVMSSGITLVYDYYYAQWGTFTNVPAVAACLFQNLHTFVDVYGRVFQETIGSYVDGSVSVLMKFTTGPIRLGELQNYQRAYCFYLLGTYLSPHKLAMSIAYDYSNSPTQMTLLTPSSLGMPNSSFGDTPGNFGGGAFGGSSIEQFRVFLQNQRCQAFSITLQEVFDSSFGIQAGAGLTLSGISVLCAFKGKAPSMSASQTFG